jgi:hypothetical protein
LVRSFPLFPRWVLLPLVEARSREIHYCPKLRLPRPLLTIDGCVWQAPSEAVFQLARAEHERRPFDFQSLDLELFRLLLPPAPSRPPPAKAKHGSAGQTADPEPQGRGCHDCDQERSEVEANREADQDVRDGREAQARWVAPGEDWPCGQATVS